MIFRSFSTCRPLVLLVGLLVGCGSASGQDEGLWTPPEYGQAFNQTWRDGNAELASYALTYPRYGEPREGTAVAITVTEPFNPEKRVKSDTGGEGTHGVIKLNLVEDFQTGVYDYNLMTSVFVATESANGLPAGSATKVSFSSQEWCGHVYQQALFSGAERGTPGVRQTSHSYFEGEADDEKLLDYPAGGMSEDALMLWARGLAGPTVKPGESVEVPVYRSLAVQRLGHVPGGWDRATLSRGDVLETVETPAGSFECEVMSAEVVSEGGEVRGRSYVFYIDHAEGGDRRLVKMTRDDGYALELTGVERLPYWNLNGNVDERELGKIGLERRGEKQM